MKNKTVSQTKQIEEIEGYKIKRDYGDKTLEECMFNVIKMVISQKLPE